MEEKITIEEKIKVLDYKAGYNYLQDILKMDLPSSGYKVMTLFFETEKEADYFVDKCKEKDISALKKPYGNNLGEVWVYHTGAMEALPHKLKLYWEIGDKIHIFDISTYTLKDDQAITEHTEDKFFITEILNDLNRNGFVSMGKADTMLRDWASELRDKMNIPRSSLRKEFNRIVGSQNW